MSRAALSTPVAGQRGMTLIAAMLLLLVITILGVSMFRSIGLQEHIAGNTREKQKALRAAEAAEYAAEVALTGNGGANASTGVACKGKVTTFQVCSNTLATSATADSQFPLNVGDTPTYTTYAVNGLTTCSNGPNCYYDVPGYYVSFISGAYNAANGASTNTYVINALGYGGTANSMAEVESAYVVNVVYTTQSNASKFINLGGP